MKAKKKIVLGISGSTKEHSASLSFLKYIAHTFPDLLDLEIYDKIDKLPHFNPDLDSENPPEEVGKLRERIAAADGVLFSTPEYVYSLPGSLKNAIEWNVSTVLFSGKPVAMIVAAASGEKAFSSLALVLTTIECLLPETSKLLIKGAAGKIDKQLQVEDSQLREEIEKVVISLLESMDRESKIPTKFNS